MDTKRLMLHSHSIIIYHSRRLLSILIIVSDMIIDNPHKKENKQENPNTPKILNTNKTLRKLWLFLYNRK